MMKIADCHAHIFPNKLASKAVNSIGNFYDSEMLCLGTSEDLINQYNGVQIKKILVSSSATKPIQVEAINEFIASQCDLHSGFLGLGTMHPDYENIDTEIEKIKKMGLKGVKLHPDFQSFNIDDEKSIKMFQKLADANLPILCHTGDKRYDASSPERMANAAKKVPNMKCIAAHFGGYNHWYDVLDYLKGIPNIMFDTSSSLYKLSNETAINMIKALGEDKFLFGTDFPMWQPKNEIERFLKLELTKKQQEKILWTNFENLFLK